MKNNHTITTTKTTISQHNVMTQTTAKNKWRTFNHHCVGCSGAGSVYSKFGVFLFNFLEPSVSCCRLFYLIFHLVFECSAHLHNRISLSFSFYLSFVQFVVIACVVFCRTKNKNRPDKQTKQTFGQRVVLTEHTKIEK